MKKLMTLMLLFAITSITFAQKNEVKVIEKAIKNSNFGDAKSALSAAEALMGSMDDKTKAKFYYLKAQALYAEGQGSDANTDEAITTLDLLKDLESSIGKLKYTEQANVMKTSMTNSYLTKANEAFTNKNYAAAAKGFEKVYKTSPKDTLYLYYAASAAVSVPDYDTALDYYIQLKNLGYNGVQMNYYATNVESGKEETFGDAKSRDFSVKAKLHNNPRDGNNDKFKALMEEATEKDPNNAELFYNLGVLAAQAGDNDEALKYYNKAIEINPNYVDAYNNIAVTILAGEASIVEQMNSLGTSSADNRKYDELKAKRTKLYNDAIPYLEKALNLRNTNVDAAKTLMNIYSVIGETEKFKAMKAKVEKMEASAGGN